MYNVYVFHASDTSFDAGLYIFIHSYMYIIYARVHITEYVWFNHLKLCA